MFKIPNKLISAKLSINMSKLKQLYVYFHDVVIENT